MSGPGPARRPVPEPRAEGLLQRPVGQLVHWREDGAAGGIPLLYVHGGPGGGLGSCGYLQQIDLRRFRAIGFDQRGCGASTPRAGEAGHDLEANTTQALIADIEALRVHLGVEAWVLNGVSWGSTLALAYAQAHPERVRAVVLFAVTTTSRFEVDWITEGCRTIFPEDWEALARAIRAERPDWTPGERRVIEVIDELMADPDQAVRERAALAWGAWEEAHVSIGAGRPQPGARSRFADPAFIVPFTTLVARYWARGAFLDAPLLARMETIAHIPGRLIHGRRDVSGPAITAWELHRAWPASTLRIIEEEGHGGAEMVRRWREANDELADLLAGASTVTSAPTRPGTAPTLDP